ncbi:MAG: hypothetical protein BJBARM4_0671 [Candidatus Parvarchaeum acidiphilum ARMAN-4]|uniref:Bacterial Pleckstrin homology domain-containing protein n=1 Tax=Candidatus Parvarchaeum acidiphilum ARMAN-4 TaxID=662760 RepID=D2EFZ0_PARA4|nr:MAG: hypothetical protein BJBARM4_0671 [Candidatus Parvarchaeum acidiphilum ARMAN-4]
MMVYSFAVSSGSFNFLLLLPIIIGLIVILLAIFTKGKNENTQGIKNTFYITIAIGATVIIIGIILFIVLNVPYTVKIGTGYISVSGPSIAGGSINITSDKIESAYVGNIVNGNVTLSVRTDGTSIGNLNAGGFLLSNNAKAYVVSDNNTDVILKLKSGSYIILGNNNTALLASIISKSVYNIS